MDLVKSLESAVYEDFPIRQVEHLELNFRTVVFTCSGYEFLHNVAVLSMDESLRIGKTIVQVNWALALRLWSIFKVFSRV